jgi:hypothetical protein
MGRAPDWDVRQHHNHCDTIAYSATGRAHPSTREARGTGGGKSSSRGTSTTPLHTAPKFLPEQGREAGRTRCGGEESELMHMIEKIYYKEDKCTHSAYAASSKTFDVQYKVK